MIKSKFFYFAKFSSPVLSSSYWRGTQKHQLTHCSTRLKVKVRGTNQTDDPGDKSDYELVDIPGKVYKRPYEVRFQIGLKHYKRKKNYTSWLKGRKGSLHPSYVDGKGAINRDYDQRYVDWITEVKQKYNFKCLITGETRKKLLHCHHLDAFKTHVEKRYLASNGVLIQKSIHNRFHKLYGKDVTVADFEDFLCKYYNWGDKPFPWRQGNHEPSLSVDSPRVPVLTANEKQMVNFKELCTSPLRGAIMKLKVVSILGPVHR